MPSDTRNNREAAVLEANERLWTGIEKCRALVSECKSALADGSAEPSIFIWPEAATDDKVAPHKGLDPNRHCRD